MSGPLFDWLRMLYRRMSYIVRHEGIVTAAFKSLLGVLTGDTASPILWNLYFADLDVPPCPSDIRLFSRTISHIEQADDVVLFSTSIEAMQIKISAFFKWCCTNFMTISVAKTEWMVFGKLPNPLPSLYIDGHQLRLVASYKYVGLWFQSTHRYIFARHYSDKASKARNVARASFAVSPMVGRIPPKEGITLYMTRVDPHLTFGCEISIDVDTKLLGLLESVQHSFLRRLLGLNSHSMLVILFTETGLLPLRYRRLELALSYAKYAAACPDSHYAKCAWMHSCNLVRKGHSSQVGDIIHVLSRLPVPVKSSVEDFLSSARLDNLIVAVRDSWITSATDAIQGSIRCTLLKARVEFDRHGHPSPAAVFASRSYLKIITVPNHRRAYLRFITSNHMLAVEVLRYTDRRYQPYVPRDWRKCRLGCDEVEDEVHALLCCEGDRDLVGLRNNFIWHNRHTELAFLIRLVFDERLLKDVAKFIYNVESIYCSRRVYIPPPIMYSQ
ncbi:hypothetical protein K435DRAFT_889798 [Dendrothele bispora CBS 962.96]|uniref:Reverse transcriptase domain-containing protein n=1 Tax=Dendrothele bispora (strain CBS 962.96) TaxID=1314807 RepID=A0A4S8KPF6_DENBC|nr:hypothetical protein K435DRAFT_892393 [Dendrothele bispora CBS 962.96]THU77942.1 hypothetical protein K435DRAFT_889798 [Dendrothele bispora CBS 962.96]